MTAAVVSHDATQVLQEALSLPLDARSYIVEHLLVSMNDEQELEARVQRRQSGETRSYSRDEVRGQIEAILA